MRTGLSTLQRQYMYMEGNKNQFQKFFVAKWTSYNELQFPIVEELIISTLAKNT